MVTHQQHDGCHMEKIKRMSDNMSFILMTDEPVDDLEREFLRSNGIKYEDTPGGGVEIFFRPDQREARYAHLEFLREAGLPFGNRFLSVIHPTK